MMNRAIRIRSQAPDQSSVIYEINKQAFNREDEAQLIERLRGTEEFIPELSLIAETEEGKIVGHILFTKIIIQGLDNIDSLALAPMAVLPDFQSCGVGSMLVKEGLKVATQFGFSSVIVLGHKDYYPKFGFKLASDWQIKCPFNVPDEAFMAIELKSGALKNSAGTVKYSTAFNL